MGGKVYLFDVFYWFYFFRKVYFFVFKFLGSGYIEVVFGELRVYGI